MTDEQKAAYVIAQAACMYAKVAGMQAENQRCVVLGGPPLHGEKAFDDVIVEYGIHHNGVLTLFHGY